jgi:hypothetical protein
MYGSASKKILQARYFYAQVLLLVHVKKWDASRNKSTSG